MTLKYVKQRELLLYEEIVRVFDWPSYFLTTKVGKIRLIYAISFLCDLKILLPLRQR